MRLTASFVAYEIRTQARSLRFRAFAGLYVLAGTAPAILVHFLRGRSPFAIGEATYVDETTAVLPVLTAVLAFLLSLDGVTREQGDGAWTTVTLCGVSNAGYLLRRWVALLAVILPLTALPFLASAGIAAADGIRPLDPGAWAGPWLFLLVPLALGMSALGLGVGTIGGGSLSSLPLLALLLAVLPALANEALHHVRLVLDTPMAWLNLRDVVYSVTRATKALQGRRDWGFDFPQPGSEAGADLGVLATQSFVMAAPLAAIAVATLGMAVLYLRRTRPDLRPRPVRPDHPLRGTLLLLTKLRERYKPDPAPALADRLAVAAGLLAAAAILGLLFGRAYDYESQADVRYAAEETAPAPTPVTVLPGRWRLDGGFAGSRVDFRVSGEMINAGRTPVGHLAFQLNRDLALEVAADRGTVAAARAWDRLTLELAPPIPPGGRRELRFHLSGVPSRTVFPQSPAGAIGGKPSFKGSYEIHRGAQFSRDRLNFAAAWREPSISGFGVDLSRGALLPIPVYGGWHREDEPAAEAVSPSAEVEVALTVPPGEFLADSCGGIAVKGRLASRCRATLADFAVVGGRHALLQEAGGQAGQGMAVAVFPAHRQVADLHLGFLSQSAGMIEEAWPGIGALGRLVVVEWKDRTRKTPYWAYFDLEDSFVKVKGNLVFLEEVNLIGVRQLNPERLVSEILAVRLAGRRRIDPKQSLFFRQFFKDVALERLGLGPANGAVVGPLHPQDEAMVQVSPFADNAYYGYWDNGFPALMSALRSRMGDEPLRAAVEEFLDRGDDPSAPPGTAEELFVLLQRRSPNPVDRLIRDSFQGPALPYPVLDGVEFRRAGEGWRVTGRMKNEGTGEALCKVVLATDLGPESTTVRADAGQSAGFELATRYRPQGVFLDPGHECHRVVRMGAPRDRVYFNGGAR